jgi:hypothetical protein
MLNSVLAGDRRQKLDAMADGELPRCRYRLLASALCMPALAGDRWLLSKTLAIVATIPLSFFYRALAARMCARPGFVFSHDPSPRLIHYHL